MALGFPAYHTEEYSIGRNDVDIPTAVRKTFDRLSWRIKQETSSQIVASVGMGLLSYGERISVRYHPDNSIFIRSQCIFPIQVFDWGKNRANVRNFIEELQHYLKTH